MLSRIDYPSMSWPPRLRSDAVFHSVRHGVPGDVHLMPQRDGRTASLGLEDAYRAGGVRGCRRAQRRVWIGTPDPTFDAGIEHARGDRADRSGRT